MGKSDIGLIGLAVMGENLALNMESRGYRVSVYNRMKPGRPSVVDKFLSERGSGKNFFGANEIEDFVESLAVPRKIFMMIKSGDPVEQTINQLLPLLDKGDIIIDGGNSDYRDTSRRTRWLEELGFYYIGAGVSGGEEGALHGPSIMPGGSVEAWPEVKDIFQSISAKLDDGTPCCEWIGRGGAGHYVKMVHNGIEYGDMQLIAEVYSLLKLKGLSNEEIADVFEEWNKGELKSYLIEITANILRFRDGDGGYELDKILDSAGQKGTGKLSTISSLEEGDPLTIITAAVYARILSSLVDERRKGAMMYERMKRTKEDVENLGIEDIKEALYLSKIGSYAQGFSLLKRTSDSLEWGLDLSSVALVWRGGCIIRSVFLSDIARAYDDGQDLDNLLFDEYFATIVRKRLWALQEVVAAGALNGVALPCMCAALCYIDGLTTEYSTANLIQAQRDYFGAHTYERVDKPRGEFFHTNWTGDGGDTVAGNYTV